MKGLTQENKICPQCGAPKLKNWKELSDEEKFLVEHLPASARFQLSERKTNLFCSRCWHETTQYESLIC